MTIARNLSKLAAGVNSSGVLAAANVAIPTYIPIFTYLGTTTQISIATGTLSILTYNGSTVIVPTY
jgi:hypothetical protein